ncbi:MAG: hypothetical protein KW802_00820 [Candidatus Doudnabacteria bacterium]|nr:hypothetical protein [Candidatus Doudnabacteria bacterium]
MKDFLTKLQEQPYETRIRILWGTVICTGIVLLVLFVFSIKSTLNGVDGKKLIDLSIASDKQQAQTEIAYASVERVERSNQNLKIYFNFNNPTDDILTIPQLADITLVAEDQTLNPQTITDRQGNVFVQKILSHTQNFGILVFPATTAATGTLNFSQMYLEKNSSNFFQQKLELNLKDLAQPTKVRN